METYDRNSNQYPYRHDSLSMHHNPRYHSTWLNCMTNTAVHPPLIVTLVLTAGVVHHCSCFDVVWMAETEGGCHSSSMSQAVHHCCTRVDSTSMTKHSSLGRSSEVLGTPCLLSLSCPAMFFCYLLLVGLIF